MTLGSRSYALFGLKDFNGKMRKLYLHCLAVLRSRENKYKALSTELTAEYLTTVPIIMLKYFVKPEKLSYISNIFKWLQS